MLCKIFALVLGFCSLVEVSVCQKPEIPAPASAAGVIDQKEESSRIKYQALAVLKDNLAKIKSIKDLRQRSDVVAEGSSTLWEYDATTAKESLVGFIEQLISEFKDI